LSELENVIYLRALTSADQAIHYMEKIEYSIEIGGKTLHAQFSDLAERANGSVILRCGDTVVLATAVMSQNKKEGQNWFPLTGPAGLLTGR
jgi:hypothetical protein